ncbi:hypothetical protein [Hugenholtzia roseola]|uniref:hypothetical protein n=1 Tax=Hugenholtzia roseola TaxID=1002 RepID=UPI00040DE8E8|nr:hypothetical protein [Hugenholtzia roseola]
MKKIAAVIVFIFLCFNSLQAQSSIESYMALFPALKMPYEINEGIFKAENVKKLNLINPDLLMEFASKDEYGSTPFVGKTYALGKFEPHPEYTALLLICDNNLTNDAPALYEVYALVYRKKDNSFVVNHEVILRYGNSANEGELYTDEGTAMITAEGIKVVQKTTTQKEGSEQVDVSTNSTNYYFKVEKEVFGW